MSRCTGIYAVHQGDDEGRDRESGGHRAHAGVEKGKSAAALIDPFTFFPSASE